MKVSWRQDKSRLNFTIILEQRDSRGPIINVVGAQRSHMFKHNKFFIDLPAGMDSTQIHPDLIGLSLIVLLNNFVGKRLFLQQPVSQKFHESYLKSTGKMILPVDNSISPRIGKDTDVPALAFSGGVDSTAALGIMPKSTHLVFTDRQQKHDDRYTKAAANKTLSKLSNEGWPIYRAKTNLEYIIEPETFPHGLASGVPAIIVADYFGFDSLAFGNILDTVYNIAHNIYSESTTLTEYDSLFSAAGLSANHVTAGMTEVATTKLIKQTRYNGLAQSCMYGDSLGKPCLNCVKCFRKTSIERILSKDTLSKQEIERFFSLDSVEAIYKNIPAVLQDAYMYIGYNLAGNAQILNLLKWKFGASKRNTNWMSSWYAPARQLLPTEYADEIENNIKKYLSTMTQEQEKIVKKWNTKKQRRSVLIWLNHWRFWQYYSKRFDKHILSFNVDDIEVKEGEVYSEELRVYKHLPLWRKQDVTGSVRWGSSDGAIAYYKDGEVRAKKTGKASLYARYGKSRISLNVKVSGK